MNAAAPVNLMLASNQWANREPSARYWNLGELATELANAPPEQEFERRWDNLRVVKVGNDLRLGTVEGIAAGVPPATFTNFAFRKFCSDLRVPADFITGTCGDNAQLAADCMNQGLTVKARDKAANAAEKGTDVAANGESCKLLMSCPTDGSTKTVRASYSKGYSRVPDAQIIAFLREHAVGWKNPPARPAHGDKRTRPATADDVLACCNAGVPVKVGDSIAPAGIYRDDRSFFAFLVDTDNRIDDGNNGGGLFHGLFVGNSEVGTKTFMVTDFLFEGVCGNHIVWNASGIEIVSKKHRGDIDTEWSKFLAAAIRRFKGADIGRAADVYAKAKTVLLGKNEDEIVKVLGDSRELGLAKGAIKSAFALATEFEETYNADPRSVWGMVHGLTRYSQTLGYADLRLKLDRTAGAILDMFVVAA